MNFLKKHIDPWLEKLGIVMVGAGAIAPEQVGQFVEANSAVLLGLAGILLAKLLSKVGKK